MNKRNTLLMVAGALVVAFLWYSTIWSSQDKAIATADAKTAKVVDSTKALKARYNGLLAAQKDEPIRRAALDQAAVAVPESVNLTAYMRTIEKLTAESGVTLQSVSQTPPSAGGSANASAAAPGLASSTVDIATTGTYAQLVTFMRMLQDNPRLIVVDTITLDPGRSGADAAAPLVAGAAPTAGGTTLSAHIKGRIFTLTSMDEADLTKPAAPTTTTTGAKK
jgi:Tfp pilus assembly protein PilO